MNTPFLYALYHDLARSQPELDATLHEYYTLLQLVSSGSYPIRTFSDLEFVLERLWVKTYEQRAPFRERLAVRRQAIEEWLSGLHTELAAAKPHREDHGATDISGQQPAQRKDAQPEEDTSRPASSPTQPATESAEKAAKEAYSGPTAKTGFSISREQLPQRTLLKLQRKQHHPIPTSQTPFHFGDEYHPVKDRQLQQAWRTLKNNRPGPASPVVDIPKTISQIAQQGYFSVFHYARHEYNQLRLVLLLDRGANMVAVESFGEKLLSAARDSKWHEDVQVWYFDRIPQRDEASSDYVFRNVLSTSKAKLREIVRGIHKKDIAVIIYSDAGAINFEYDEQRSREWVAFAGCVRQWVGHVAWINPAPRNRWDMSNAGRLAQQIPMFESDRPGIEGAIAALKGKPTLIR